MQKFRIVYFVSSTSYLFDVTGLVTFTFTHFRFDTRSRREVLIIAVAKEVDFPVDSKVVGVTHQ